MDYIKAFLVGGMICALAQVLLDRTRLMPGRVMVLLVVSGCILGFAGVYEPFARWAGAGASVPLLGFGNTLWKGVKEGIEKEGLLGIFKGGLTGQLRRNLWRPGVWLSVIPGVPTETERIRAAVCAMHGQ